MWLFKKYCKILKVKITKIWFDILNQRRSFSFVARYSFKLTRCSLLIVKSLVTRCKICLLLVAEVTRYKNLLVTRCRSCPLQKKSLVTRCKIRLLLVVEVAKLTRYLFQKLFLTKNHSLVVAKFACYSLQQITCYSMQKIIHRSLKQSLKSIKLGESLAFLI